MRHLAWLYKWLDAFLPLVWRRNDYYCQGERMTVRNAAFIAKVVADIRFGKKRKD